MNIYILQNNPKFNPAQMKMLKRAGKVILIKGEKVNLSKAVFTKDLEPKIVAVSPNAVSWKFPNEVIEKIPNLKAICVPSTAYDWIDGEFLKKRNAILTNVPKYSTNSVAEYAIFMMLALARKFAIQIKNGFKQTYNNDMLLEEVGGKTMGIVGLGTI